MIISVRVLSTSESCSIRPSSRTTCVRTADSFPDPARAHHLRARQQDSEAADVYRRDLSLRWSACCPEWLIAGHPPGSHLGWGIGSWFDRHFPAWFCEGLGVQFYFGGTSLLIVVGVAMDTGAAARGAAGHAELRRALLARVGCAAGGNVRKAQVAPDTRHPDKLAAR